MQGFSEAVDLAGLCAMLRGGAVYSSLQRAQDTFEEGQHYDMLLDMDSQEEEVMSCYVTG